MPDATSARRHLLAVPAAGQLGSESSPHHCNRDTFRRRRNSLACSAETSPVVGFRATTAVAQLLHDAPPGIKDSIRKRRQSLQTTSDKSRLHRLASPPISANEAAWARASPELKLEQMTIEALSRSIAVNKCSTAPSRQAPLSAAKFFRRSSTTSDYVSNPDVDSVIRRTRHDHPHSLTMLVRHDKLQLAGKSEREWASLARNSTDHSALLGAAHMLTLDTGMTLM
ncbi:hypothetical protein T484DRAFT_1923324 [Baffinella frigidus]|nr:hypothetical protein T484DRAFT_1923324 [Cryptophyta sp. CCMP2293]|eukprot:CAMPEP_0180147146 /NCGR_PEP_ID=MMETSP0986-20121125/19055_1 /TAXON_ID=697907 /ORGANISM="non described non described, Strain CCMP2293" /LENGTH=225 /DNA_ID=CAMNT_0022092585 /DNA_START=58 /DNA_END=735 /DNA_ORIENTATION=+